MVDIYLTQDVLLILTTNSQDTKWWMTQFICMCKVCSYSEFDHTVCWDCCSVSDIPYSRHLHSQSGSPYIWWSASRPISHRNPKWAHDHFCLCTDGYR